MIGCLEMKENAFQAGLIKELKAKFPGCMVLKNDANYIQGFPDLTVLFSNGKWAVLECKKDANAKRQPNQQYYISQLSPLGYAAFIYPENKEDILLELGKYTS